MMRLESAPVVLVFSVARAGDVSGSSLRGPPRTGDMHAQALRGLFLRAASDRPRASSASPTSEAAIRAIGRTYPPERSSAGFGSSIRYRLPEIIGGAGRRIQYAPTLIRY